jgi:uncharacterized damage-inducible protein DinB
MDTSKHKALENLKFAHQYFQKVISNLDQSQIIKKNTIDKWSVKDVVAHLSAWNIEYLEEINRILKNESTWNKLYASTEGDDRFNNLQVAKRKNWPWGRIREEWDNSYSKLINKVKELTDEQWTQEVSNEYWKASQELPNKPVTIESLFIYEIAGNAHELSHAKEVEKNIQK